jgi:hypothetical protein
MKRVRLVVEGDCEAEPDPAGYQVRIRSLEDEFLDVYNAVIAEVTVIGDDGEGEEAKQDG